VVVAVLVVVALVLVLGLRAVTSSAPASPWAGFPVVSGATVVVEQSGHADSEDYEYSARLVEAPGRTGAQLTASYVDGLTAAGWQLLQSYPALDGVGFTRVCLAVEDGEGPRLADIYAVEAGASQLGGAVEVVVSHRVADQALCGDALGHIAVPKADKPAG
jgi:hypothetical protein